MSILDRAKRQLEERFKGVGEETVRVMDAVNEEPEPKERKAPKEKPVRQKQAEKSKDNEKFSFKNRILSRPEKEDIKEGKPAPKQAEMITEENDDAFDYDESIEKEYFETMGKKHSKKMKAYEQVPVPVVDEGKLQDILKLLQIPPTFEIDSDIYLPDDLNSIAFDIQVPQGYETSEVDTFVSRTKISVTKYVELLHLRNEHIAKLATVIDRLQVDVSNMKLESEIANGINIMPTHDTEHLEQENFELKSLVKRLEEQIEDGTNDDALTTREREMFEQLQDEVSIKDRQIEGLKEELYNTKTQLSMLEEERDEESDFPQEAYDNYREQNYVDNNEPLPEVENEYGASSLPDLNENNSNIELPDLSDSLFEDSNVSYESTQSAFEDDEESIEDFLMRNQSYYQGNNDNESSIDILDDNGKSYEYESSGVGTYFDDDEYDEEFDKLQNWGKN